MSEIKKKRERKIDGTVTRKTNIIERALCKQCTAFIHSFVHSALCIKLSESDRQKKSLECAV